MKNEIAEFSRSKIKDIVSPKAQEKSFFNPNIYPNDISIIISKKNIYIQII